MNDTMIGEYLKCYKDIEYFAEHLNIKLTDIQKKALSLYNEGHAISFDTRYELKEATAIYVLWYVIFNQDKTVVMLGNVHLNAMKLLEHVVDLYAKMPKEFKVQINMSSRTSLRLTNGCTIIARALTPSSLRGMSTSLVVIDEFDLPARKEYTKEFFMNSMPQMLSTNSKIILNTSASIHNCSDFMFDMSFIIRMSKILIAPVKENNYA